MSTTSITTAPTKPTSHDVMDFEKLIEDTENKKSDRSISRIKTYNISKLSKKNKKPYQISAPVSKKTKPVTKNVDNEYDGETSNSNEFENQLQQIMDDLNIAPLDEVVAPAPPPPQQSVPVTVKNACNHEILSPYAWTVEANHIYADQILQEEMEKTKYAKAETNGSISHSHVIYLNSVAPPTGSTKAVNINMVFNKQQKAFQTIWFNSNEKHQPPFQMSPKAAEFILSELYHMCHRIPATQQQEYPALENEGDFQIRVDKSSLCIQKTMNSIVYQFRVIYNEIEEFKKELHAAITTLKWYPNIQKCRKETMKFINDEFTNCVCADMNEKQAVRLIKNFYYKLPYYPLPPHHLTIGDILHRVFVATI